MRRGGGGAVHAAQAGRGAAGCGEGARGGGTGRPGGAARLLDEAEAMAPGDIVMERGRFDLAMREGT